MFNNIIYFIVVLLIFNVSYPGSQPKGSLAQTLLMLFLSWLVFAVCCRWGFQSLMRRYRAGNAYGGLAAVYQSLNLRLSLLAIFLFALDIYIFQVKYWIQAIPGVAAFSVLQGIVGLSLFMFYLCTVWYFSHPAYRSAFHTDIGRRAFIVSQVKFNVPILFPWMALSLIFDLLSLSPWSTPDSFLNSPTGQITFFAGFLVVLMIFMPLVIQYWWGCRPPDPSEKVRALREFLRDRGFRYRALLLWPIFQGRMMTAGIMGVVARYRYILVTNGLMEILSTEELKGVLAHEMGHAKYRHLVFYMVFFLGFMILSFGLFDLCVYFFANWSFFLEILASSESRATTLFYLMVSLPILIAMVVYFRFIMGFFMRNFERQADLFSASTMGSPIPAIMSLEKIALLSGKSRELPSWHHFSIKERVDYLRRSEKEPGLARRHTRFVTFSIVIYLAAIAGLGYLLNFGPLEERIGIWKLEQKMQAYERIIQMDPRQSVAYNELAWYLATAPYEELRDPAKAIALAKRAVALEPLPIYLDTLAEAYYADGQYEKAVEVIKEAIATAKERKDYYEGQLRKFREAMEQ
jgi:Zn-dependent protease with chaperone function